MRPRWSPSAAVLRALVLALPVAALLVGLPRVPHTAVLVLVVVGALRWAVLPEDSVGVVVLALVGGWWAVHGVTDARVLVVAVLLVAAHVAATLASYGPPAMAVDGPTVRVWVRRGTLVLLAAPVAWLAVRHLDDVQAPAGTWPVAFLLVAAGALLASRATVSEPDGE